MQCTTNVTNGPSKLYMNMGLSVAKDIAIRKINMFLLNCKASYRPRKGFFSNKNFNLEGQFPCHLLGLLLAFMGISISKILIVKSA